MPTVDIGKIKIVWRQGFNSQTTYKKDDAVFYNGSAFIALDTSTGITPTSGGQFWDLMVQGFVPGQTVLSFANIAALYNYNASGLFNSQLVFVEGYYTKNDRGGGNFVWDNTSSRADDAGSVLQPFSLSAGQVGRWIRDLAGDRANVKMWGAFGDGVSNDFSPITAAVAAMANGWTNELVFPAAAYAVNNTIILPSKTKLVGEGSSNTIVIMLSTASNKDILITSNANAPLTSVNDDGLTIRDIGFAFQNTNTTNAAIVVSQPGQGHSLENLVLSGGAYGIRCKGIGTPGLRLKDITVVNPAIAGLKVEPLSAANAIGQVVLDGFAINAPNTNFGTGIWLSKVAGNVSIVGLNATGAYKFSPSGYGGVVFWDVPTLANGETAGQLSIDSCNNQGDGTRASSFIVLSSSSPNPLSAGGQHLPAIKVGNCALQNCSAIISDTVTGYTLPTRGLSGLQQGEAVVPFTYEVDSATDVASNVLIRLTKVDNQVMQFIPTNPGWWRIFRGTGSNIGGNFSIVSPYDSSNFDVYHNTSSTPVSYGLLKANRYVKKTTSNPILSSAVDRVRTIYNNNGELFIDIYVNQLPNITSSKLTDKTIYLSHKTDGRENVELEGFCIPTQVLSVDATATVSYNQIRLNGHAVNSSGGNYDAGRIQVGDNSIFYGSDLFPRGFNEGVSVVFANVPGVSGQNAKARAFITNGVIEYVQVLSGGYNYTVSPSAFIVTNEWSNINNYIVKGGVGASLSARIASGAVTSVVVLNGGSGYGSEPIEQSGHPILTGPENRFGYRYVANEVVQVARQFQFTRYYFKNDAANSYVLHLDTSLVGPGLGSGIFNILFPGDKIIDDSGRVVEVSEVVDFQTVILKNPYPVYIPGSTKFTMCSWELLPPLDDYTYTPIETPQIQWVPNYTIDASFDASSNNVIPNWATAVNQGAAGPYGSYSSAIAQGWAFVVETKQSSFNFPNTETALAYQSWWTLESTSTSPFNGGAMIYIGSAYRPFARGYALDFVKRNGLTFDIPTVGNRGILLCKFIKVRKKWFGQRFSSLY